MLDLIISVAPATDNAGWLDYISRVGVVAILIISHYGFYKRWWIWGAEYKDLVLRHDLLRKRCAKVEEELQAWKEQALTGQRLAERTTTIAEAAISRAQRGGK